MATLQKIAPCLWFDGKAEEAAKLYVSVFEKDSRIVRIARYQDVGQEVHGQQPGSVMTVEFELLGQPITGLNGGPHFQFSEAISLQVYCDTQAEIDRYWEKLSAGGDPNAQQCGWLKDKYGLSWQIVPSAMAGWMTDSDGRRAGRVMGALLKMKKLDIAALDRAAANE